MAIRKSNAAASATALPTTTAPVGIPAKNVRKRKTVKRKGVAMQSSSAPAAAIVQEFNSKQTALAIGLFNQVYVPTLTLAANIKRCELMFATAMTGAIAPTSSS